MRKVNLEDAAVQKPLMEDMKMVDWKSEREKANEEGSLSFWKPPEGTSKVVLLDEGKEDSYTFDDGSTVHQVVFTIEYGGKQHKWGVPKAHKKTSLFQQVAKVAEIHNDALTGKVLTIIRQGSGMDTRYTIIEAVQQEEKESKIQ